MTEEKPIKNIDELLGEEFGDKIGEQLGELPNPEPLIPKGVATPECSFCSSSAVYLLEKVFILVRTNEGAHHQIESVPNQAVIAACINHKDSERDQEIAEGVHLSVINETSVPSELEHFDVYWKLI